MNARSISLKSNEACRVYRDDIHLWRPGFGVREWFEYFSFTFNQPFIYVDFRYRNERKYTFESVLKLLKGFSIGGMITRENPCEVLRHFPVMQYLRLDKARLEPELPKADLNFIKKILLGNIPRVEIKRAIPMDLNTLLMMNSPKITSWRTSLTDKELNTFLKLWMKGANQNLESLVLRYHFIFRRGRLIRTFNTTRTFNKNVIFKGVGYQLLNDEDSEPKYHIRKSDGTLGVVSFEINGIHLKVEPLQ